MTYRGGRLVLGTGSSWPHDFLFFVGFFSSWSSSTGSGESKEVSAGETVKISGEGDADIASKGLMVLVMILWMAGAVVWWRMRGQRSQRGSLRNALYLRKATLSSRSGTGNPWSSGEGVSQRGGRGWQSEENRLVWWESSKVQQWECGQFK